MSLIWPPQADTPLLAAIKSLFLLMPRPQGGGEVHFHGLAVFKKVRQAENLLMIWFV